MTLEEIESRCKNPHKKIKSLHWQGTYYGIGKWIKNYGFFPQSLPLSILTDHSGPSMYDEVPVAEQKLKVYAILKSSSRIAKLYQKIYGKKCHVVLSPSVYYCRKNNIAKSKEAKGTLVFAAHTTEHIEDTSNIDEYIQSLKELPQKYQPITICIHPIDVNKGLHLKYGPHFEVVSVGHHQHPDFIERFYDILCNFQYTSSNIVGSYTFYATEMGIPFFLHGDKPSLINKSDPNLNLGKMEIEHISNTNRYAYQLFSKKVDRITPEQKDFVEYELGLTEGCSRIQLSLILWKAYMKYVLDTKLKGRIKKAMALLMPHGLYHYLTRKKSYPDRKIISEADYDKLVKLPRYTQTEIRLFGDNFKIADAKSFLFMYREIFRREIYKFKSQRESPRVIDCGANIGMSIIYFKQLYKNAEVIAFEPDPYIFSLLKENTASFGLDNVQLMKKGLWNQETTLRFASEGADGGRVSKLDNGDEMTDIEVVKLSEFLKEPTDFLKIDIEGAELTVLEECQEELVNVKNIFIEYHSFTKQDQKFEDILIILKKAGFRYYIDSPGLISRNPYMEIKEMLGMDMQLNIYCIR